MMWRIRRSAGRTLRAAMPVVAVLAIGACDDDSTDPGPIYTWDGELAGTGEFEDVIGAVAAVSNASSFSIAIEISGAPEEAVFAWTVAEGSCDDPGDAVGSASSYPDLEVDDEGGADAETNVAAALDGDGDYIVVVSDESGDEPVTAACGALERD